jgi:hypothetical protein
MHREADLWDDRMHWTSRIRRHRRGSWSDTSDRDDTGRLEQVSAAHIDSFGIGVITNLRQLLCRVRCIGWRHVKPQERLWNV